MKALILGMLLFAGGTAFAAATGGTVENQNLAWHWRLVDGKVYPARVVDKRIDKTLPLTGECFRLVLGNGTVLKSSDFTPVGVPVVKRLAPDQASPTVGRHYPGHKLVVRLEAPAQHLRAEWEVRLRQGATYERQVLHLRTTGPDVLVKRVVLFAQAVSGAKTVGSVTGSPVVAGTFFFGYEHPMAQNTVGPGHEVTCSYLRNAVLRGGETLTQSCVVGIVPAGQLRRGFLAYIERQRAHPYRPFLHYNSWYDISWGPKYNATQCVNAIRQFGQQLVEKRGVKMDSFLFDDGWDNNRTLWAFNSGFPDGFTPLCKEAAKYHAHIGVWLSPFGGYGRARQQRLEYGRKQGYEINASGFSLAGPKYYHRFHDICMMMVRKYGVNQFKFDGLAAGAKASAHGLTRDGDAMLRLIADLRKAEPDIYINQTTGTWPSPFWLLYVDSTWRGGSDHSFYGAGSYCQQWMTYRDMETYRNVVRRAPLYPLNSLMLHGIIYAAHAYHLTKESDQDFRDQVRAYFGNGTQLQEMYITPSLLDQQNWDDLAEAAKWSRANADVLVDTHWIGGDPGKGQVYGWADWSSRKAILVLRNPNAHVASFTGDVQQLLQLPPGARKSYHFHSPWKADRDLPTLDLTAGQPHTFTLQPFQVVVLESL